MTKWRKTIERNGDIFEQSMFDYLDMGGIYPLQWDNNVDRMGYNMGIYP
jgi:hypothetical protein